VSNIRVSRLRIPDQYARCSTRSACGIALSRSLGSTPLWCDQRHGARPLGCGSRRVTRSEMPLMLAVAVVSMVRSPSAVAVQVSIH